MNNWLNFGGDPDHHYWEIRKLVLAYCAARRCRAGHALAGVAIATMTSLRHRPLADVGAVPMLLILNDVIGYVRLNYYYIRLTAFFQDNLSNPAPEW